MEWGIRFEGGSDLAEWLARGFAELKDEKTEFTISPASVRLIKPDVAVTDGSFEIRFASGDTMGALFTTVNVERDGKWLIEGAQSMVPLPKDPELAAVRLAWPKLPAVLPGHVRTKIRSLLGPRGGRSADEEALHALRQAWETAVNQRDVQGLVKRFAPEGDFRTDWGEVLKGRAEIERYYTRQFAENQGVRVKGFLRSIRFIKPDVAMADGTYEVYSPSADTPTTRGLYFAIAVKHDGRWQVECARPMVPVPLGAPDWGAVAGAWPTLSEDVRVQIRKLVVESTHHGK